MTQTAKDRDYGFNPQEVELAQGELKVALMFADYSSASYSRGELQHALDARSKARFLSARATARLTAAERQRHAD